MNRYIACLFGLILLVVAACTPSLRPTQESVPPGVTPDVSRFVSDQLKSGDASQTDQAAQELTNWARDASGLRASLGPRADEFFDLADQAETAVEQDILRQLQPGSKPKGMPAPLPPRLRGYIGSDEFAGLGSLLTIFVTAPVVLGSPQDGNTNPITSANEFDQAVGENARAHAKIKSTVTGSRMEVQVEMTIRVEKDAKVYEEQANGKISLNVCPDPEGNVPVDLSIQNKAGASAEGYSLQFTNHGIGHVDDEANLTSYDQDIQSEISVTKGKNWLTGAPDTSFAQVNTSFTLGGLMSKDSNNWSVTGLHTSVPRTSFFVSDQLKKVINSATETEIKFGMLVDGIVLKIAQQKWQGGYCVAVAVAEGEEQRVMKGSETPFTATVRHKFEGKELPLPVIATLTKGKVSVTPTGTKVQAPAIFRYKAPDEVGEEGATVELVSRSRRGIGKLDVTFRTEEPFYSVDAPWAGSTIQLTGTICAFDKPFTLKLGGNKPGAGPYTGKVEFTPKDATSGNWMATGTYTLGINPPTNDSGGSTYQITGLVDGKPEIMLNEFTQTGVSPLPPDVSRFFGVGPLVNTYHWPGMQIPLTQETGACSSE